MIQSFAAKIIRPRKHVAPRRTRTASREPAPPKNRPYNNLPGHSHERTFSCCRQLPLRNRDGAREWFQGALRPARRRRNLAVWHYVVMPERVLVYPRDPVCG